MGRPTDYTPELAAEICSQIGAGMALVDICKADGMPARSSVYLWLAANPAFSDMYARAREEQADTYADEVIGIADGEGDPNDKRVRIDARKWAASKLKPKRYGDKLDVSAEVKVGLFDLLSSLGPETEGRADS